MKAALFVSAFLLAMPLGLLLARFIEVLDPRAATRISQAEQSAGKPSALESSLSGLMVRWMPGIVRQAHSDLYWAVFLDPSWRKRSPAQVLGAQLLQSAALGLTAWLALDTPLALMGGCVAGWSLASASLKGKAELARLRIALELPEFVQLLAAESASGAALDLILPRAAGGTSLCSAWFRKVLDQAAGRSLFDREGTRGALRSAAEESGHPGLISLAIQLGFVGRGVQVQPLLASLARTFSDEFVAQAETRAEKLGTTLGVLSAIFYFMPFVITVLVIVGVPLIATIQGS